MNYNCPACQRILYNRALTHCGFCGAKIPEELRFTPEEIVALEKLKCDLEEDHLERQRVASDQGWRRDRYDMSGLL